MIKYKDREATLGEKSSVYFNLHRKQFSIKQSGKVQGHANVVKLHNATFKVNESGRRKVIKEQRKNVHAFVNGELSEYTGEGLHGYREAYYNPYKVSTFIDKATGRPLREAKQVILSGRSIFYK